MFNIVVIFVVIVSFCAKDDSFVHGETFTFTCQLPFNSSWRTVAVYSSKSPYTHTAFFQKVESSNIIKTCTADNCSSSLSTLTFRIKFYNRSSYDGSKYFCTVAVDGQMFKNSSMTLQINDRNSTLTILPKGNISVEEHTEAKINCQSYDSATDPILWYMVKGKQNTNITDYSTFTRSNGTSVLRYIGNKSDSGAYINCSQGAQQSSVKLSIVYGPDNVSISNSGLHSNEVAEFDSFNLSCFADCNPKCRFEWTRNSKEMNHTDFHLSIRNVSRNESGNYTCMVKNSYGNKTTSVSVYVLYAAVVTGINTQNNRTTFGEKERVEFVCSVDANPIPNITWMKNDVVLAISSNQRYEISETNCSDSGNYTCGVGKYPTSDPLALSIHDCDGDGLNPIAIAILAVAPLIIVLVIIIYFVISFKLKKKSKNSKETGAENKRKTNSGNQNPDSTQYDGSYRVNSMYIPYVPGNLDSDAEHADPKPTELEKDSEVKPSKVDINLNGTEKPDYPVRKLQPKQRSHIYVYVDIPDPGKPTENRSQGNLYSFGEDLSSKDNKDDKDPIKKCKPCPRNRNKTSPNITRDKKDERPKEAISSTDNIGTKYSTIQIENSQKGSSDCRVKQKKVAIPKFEVIDEKEPTDTETPPEVPEKTYLAFQLDTEY